MLELSDAQISSWVGQFLLPLFRIAAMLMVMPIIGTQLVPTRVRLYLALAITIVLVPVLPPMPQVDALNLRSLLLILEQVLIGAMFGFILQLFFHLFAVAGQIIAMQMGLGFASMVDPTNGVSVPVLGQFMLMLVTLLFLAINGHLVALEILAESFVTLPYGQGFMVNHYWTLAGKLSWVIGAGLLLTLPAVTALLVINLVGLGLGPTLVGWLSDLLKPGFGEDSLRYALVIIVLMTPWALFHYWRAGVLLKRDEDLAR